MIVTVVAVLIGAVVLLLAFGSLFESEVSGWRNRKAMNKFFNHLKNTGWRELK